MDPMPPPAILCRPDEVHVVTTARLQVVGTRRRDLPLQVMLGSDADSQRWLGWRPEDVVPVAEPMIADPLGRRTRTVPVTASCLSFAGIDPTTRRVLTSVSLTRQEDHHEAGGMVHPAHRGCGLGTETLIAVLALAHRHLGIARVRAGCEPHNHASRRWLVKAGFMSAPGPATHTLPNGRAVGSLWWEHLDPTATPHCHHLPRKHRPRRLRMPWLRDEA
jgi:RimJ/RimL family protein N-acetyltransferase